MSEPLRKLTIEGYKSIRKLENFELRALNVLIGANGVGKSNFLGLFRLLRELIAQRLQLHLGVEGGADRCLHLGPKETQRLMMKLSFGEESYEFGLVPAKADNRLVFGREDVKFIDGYEAWLATGDAETSLRDFTGDGSLPPFLEGASRCVAYHFHDTSAFAGVRRQKNINDDEYLRPDAENLAAFLYRIRHTHPASYAKIRDVVRLAAPFFDDFKLRPVTPNPELIQLEWIQRGTDYPFLPSQLSDGTLRFMCLATALHQPSPPSLMLFDEPELGLHPDALGLLAALLSRAAAAYEDHPGSQIIVATQSAPLVSEFDPEDVVVVTRTQGESFFKRLESAPLSEWLEEYSLGELWRKNVIGGGPTREDTPLEAIHR